MKNCAGGHREVGRNRPRPRREVALGSRSSALSDTRKRSMAPKKTIQKKTKEAASKAASKSSASGGATVKIEACKS